MLVSMMSAALLIAAQVASVSPVNTVPSDIAVVAPAVLAPDCGGLLRAQAFCVSSRMDQMEAIGETYIAQLGEMGWIAADGDANRVIFIKRREAGGCDGLQMVAFFDPAKPQTADETAYLAFANIPGDVCAAPAGGADQ